MFISHQTLLVLVFIRECDEHYDDERYDGGYCFDLHRQHSVQFTTLDQVHSLLIWVQHPYHLLKITNLTLQELHQLDKVLITSADNQYLLQ